MGVYVDGVRRTVESSDNPFVNIPVISCDKNVMIIFERFAWLDIAFWILLSLVLLLSGHILIRWRTS
jgi:hypothetical protein